MGRTNRKRYYPNTWEAVHLIVLYIFLQSLVDFPLALYDYHYDTDWLSNTWIGLSSTVLITGFIFVFGYKKAAQGFQQVFALKLFNPLLLLPVVIILPALQYLVGILNAEIDKVFPPPPWFWELFERIFDNRFGFWGVILKVVVIAPVIEEILFRGIIMHGLMRNYRPWYAILLSGILFSFFHLNPWQMSYTFFLGLFLGWIMVRTRSLPLAIIVHALNNLIVFLSIQYHPVMMENALFRLPHEVNFKISVLALALGIILIVLITFRRREQNHLNSKKE